MSRNAIETLIGALVLIVAGIFVVFAYSTANLRPVSGYSLMARFDRADGVQSGSDVRISGIKVGSVTGLELDPQTFLAVITMTLDPRVQVPVDSVAKITSDGLLGSKYMALDPGGAEETIPDGGEIVYTQSSLALEDLIGQYIFSSGESQGTNEN